MLFYDLVYLFLIAILSAGSGLALLRLLGELPRQWVDALALAIPLGLGGMGLATLILGEVGALQSVGIGGILGLFALVAIPTLLGFIKEQVEQPPARPILTIFDIFLGIVVVGTLVAALAPVTDGDALCYHLQVPKVFLAKGMMGFEPDLHETIYPLLTEMLYADAIALRGPVACRLIQWLLGVVFALNVTAMARPILGERARWAGTIALLVPAVSNGMGVPLNDVALAAFGNAALFGWTRWHDKHTATRAVLTGVLAGLAIGVKYPALILAGLIGLSMSIELALQRFAPKLLGAQSNGGTGSTTGQSWSIRHIKDRYYIDPLDVLSFERKIGPYDTPRYRRQWPQVVLFGFVAFVIGCCWYVRAYHYTGNPVYPFFRQVFGGSGLDEVLDPIKRPMHVTAWNLLTALGPLTLAPARFDSFPHQFGPIFLLVLPALLFERPRRRVWGIVALGYLFLMICLTQRQSMRFVLVAVGPMSIGAAWLASKWWDRRTIPARVLVICLILCLGMEATIALVRTRNGLSFMFGRESESAYLDRREPTYHVGQWIDKHLSAKARLIGQDHRGFYIPRGYAMELAYRRRTGLGTHGETPEAITAALRSDGFTHLLMCPPDPEDAVEFDPTLSRKLAPWLDRRVPLYHETITDPDKVTRRYAIYDLNDSPDAVHAASRLSP